MSGSEEEEDFPWGKSRQHQRGSRPPRARAGRARMGDGRDKKRGRLFPDQSRGRGGFRSGNGKGRNPLSSSPVPSYKADRDSWTRGLSSPGSGRRPSTSSVRGSRESLGQGIRDQGWESTTRQLVSSPQNQHIIRRFGGGTETASSSPDSHARNRLGGPGRADGARRRRFLTDETLQELTQEDDPDNVMMAFSCNHGGLKDLLGKPNLQLSTLTLLLRCLPAVCLSQQRAHVTHILSILCESGFFRNHVMTFASSLLQAVASGSLDRGFRDVLAALTVVPDLMNQVLQRLPSSAEKCKPALVLLREALKVCNVKGEHNDLLAALERSELECLEEMRQQQQQQQEGRRRRRDRGMASRDDLPPEDFRSLPVFPTHYDLQLDERPFLRANVTKGKYRDAEQYLDIQFRLLREDYIAPLRESIGAYRKQLEEEGRPPRYVKGIKMYRGVHVIDTRCEESVEHVLQFDNNMGRVRWDASKRLITGSLVCLTNDHFKTLVFATVTGRRVEDLEKGNVNVQFELLDLDASRFTKEHSALMVESSAFFEAYRPVLECLKAFQTPLPFERYIVHVHPYVDPPAYLNNEAHYDLQCLLNPEIRLTSSKAALREKHSLISADANEAKSSVEQLLDVRGHPCDSQNVPVLQLDQWPAACNLRLNQSQLEAVQTALTKELAIIQGPPGTGKTYVGLQVVKVLLRNSKRFLPESCVVKDEAQDLDKDGDNETTEMHSPTDEMSLSHSAECSDDELASSKETTQITEAKPILVVCYTNHALDQFLEGILEFCPNGIVRVGGRSKSENLAKYNLRELQQRQDVRGKVRAVVRDGFFECRKEMRKTQTIMEGKKAQIALSTAGIVNQKFLEMGMTRNQLSTLLGDQPGNAWGDENPLLAWLGFGRKCMFSNERDRLQIHQILCGILNNSLFMDDKQRIFEGKNMNTYLEALKYYQYTVENFISQLEQAQEQAFGKKRKNIRHKVDEMQRLLRRSWQEILPMEQIRPFLEHYTQYAMDGLSVREWLGIHADPALCADMLLALHKLVKQAPQQQQPPAAGVDKTAGELGEAELLCQERALDDRDALLTGGDVSEAALEGARSELLLTPQAFQLPPIHLPGGHVINHKMDQLGQRLAEVLQGKEEASEEEADQVEDVWSVPPARRSALYRLFVRKAVRSMTESLRGDLDYYRDLASRRSELSMENTVDILKTATVIGMTTTGAAKHSSAIRKVRPRVVVVEEAAEVLESHLLATLHPGCQQLLLIGDHQQLRPTPAVYELAKRFRLDVSLFERMVTNKVHHKVLNVQHRMRPEISVLVKPLYPDLADHPSVVSRDHIRGMGCDVFFLQHEHEEEQVADTHTKANHYEAKMLVALCGYLLQQGYNPDKITILATYMGQVSLIRDLMKKDTVISGFTGSDSKAGLIYSRDASSKWERVNVTPVDNFQGEENDIILLSLVRSNEDGSVGFLSIDNRVCVALSRARLGLFAAGNLRLLAHKSSLWKTVYDTLQAAGQLGPSLPLRCQCHPDQTYHVTRPEEFAKIAPNGGCNLFCGQQLPCGHLCEETCHPLMDAEYHQNKQCTLPCKTICSNGHPCRKPCFKTCGRCKVPVQKTMSRCGHLQSMLCYEKEDWECQEPCPKTMACGHKCNWTCHICRDSCTHCLEPVQKILPCGHEQAAECYEKPENIKCVSQVTVTRKRCGHDMTVVCHSRSLVEGMDCGFLIEKTIEECGHKIQLKCYENPTRSQCKNICNKELPCSHKCQHVCSGCFPKTVFPYLQMLNADHLPCQQKIEVTLDCGHKTETACCDKDKATCESICEVVLICGHQCQGKCAVCTKQGTHGSCRTLVSRRLNCGHQASQVKCDDLRTYVCYEICGATQACGHACQAACNKCLQGRLHQPCSAPCGKPLPCNHSCNKRCGDDCQPCQARCIVKCPHGGCQQSCGAPCKPCPKPCLRRCGHVTCPLKCSDICSVPPCNRPCKRRRKMKCGHACSGVCGEPCFCRKCNADKIRSISLKPHLQKKQETETKQEPNRGEESQSSSASNQTENTAEEVPQDDPTSEIVDITAQDSQAMTGRQDSNECSTENQTEQRGVEHTTECSPRTDQMVAAKREDVYVKQSEVSSSTENDNDTLDNTKKSSDLRPEDGTPTERAQTEPESAQQEVTKTTPSEAKKEKDVTREKLKKTLFRLHDCGHIFPINDLDDYMATCVEPGRLPTCPDCGVQVLFNVRYGDLIKRTLAQREEVKKEAQTVPMTPVNIEDIPVLMDTVSLKQQDFKKLIDFNKKLIHAPSPRLVSSFRRRLNLLRALTSRKGLQRWMTKNMSFVDEDLQKQIEAYKDVLLESTEEVSPAEEDEQLELDRLSLFARLCFIKQNLPNGNKRGDKCEEYIKHKTDKFSSGLRSAEISKPAFSSFYDKMVARMKGEAYLHARLLAEKSTEKSKDSYSRNFWDVEDERLQQRLTAVYAALAAGDAVREQFDEMTETYTALLASLTSQPLMADVVTRVGTFPDLRAISSGTGWSADRGDDAEDSSESEDDDKNHTKAEADKKTSRQLSVSMRKTATSKSQVEDLLSTTGEMLYRFQRQRGRGKGRGKRQNRQRQQQQDQLHSHQEQQHYGQQVHEEQQQYQHQRQQQLTLLDFNANPAQAGRYGQVKADFTVQPRQRGGRGGHKRGRPNRKPRS